MVASNSEERQKKVLTSQCAAACVCARESAILTPLRVFSAAGLCTAVGSKCIAYGPGLETGVLGKEGHVMVQAVNGFGENITWHEGWGAVVTNDPINTHLRIGDDGVVHLRFIWRLAAPTEVGITLRGQHIKGSPWRVAVKERTTLAPGPEPAPRAPAWEEGEPRHAFVTLVTSHSFVSGAVVLVHTLRATATDIMRVALVTTDVDEAHRAVLQSAGWDVQEVAKLPNPNAGHKEHFKDVYTKLQVWSL